MKKVSVFLGCCLLFAAALSLGAGFSILEQSVGGLGRSLAGMTASYDDPSALYFNPAGAAWATRPALIVGNHFLTGDVRFHDSGNSTVHGNNSGNLIRLTMIPNVDFVYPIGDGLCLGVAMSATSGTAVHYNHDWMARYLAVDNDVAVMEIMPSLSYQITDKLAIAIGAIAQYAEVEMRQAIPTSALGFGRDVWMHAKGDTLSYGFTAGLVYRPTEKTSLGLGYRSKMTHDVHLRTRFYHVPAALGAYLGVNGKHFWDSADLSLDMPQNVNFGIQQKVTDNLTLMADLAWTDWSSMKEMTIKFKRAKLFQAAGMGKKQTEKMNWHDSWRVALGGEYKLREKWTLRAGVAYDQRTVTAHETKTAKLPDSNRYWVSCGCSYQWNEHLRLDAAFVHLFFQPSSIVQYDATGAKLHGKYRGYTNLLSLGMKYEF